jgi:hypothetical protein
MRKDLETRPKCLVKQSGRWELTGMVIIGEFGLPVLSKRCTHSIYNMGEFWSTVAILRSRLTCRLGKGAHGLLICPVPHCLIAEI